jgi:polyferredoxin
MACITCGLCIDACNDMMTKIDKPRGLIDYLALTDETRERAGQPPKPLMQHIFRPRTVLYTVLWAGVGIGLVVALFIRKDIEIDVTPVRSPVYVTLADGSIRDTYDLRLRNKHGEDRVFVLSADDAPFTLSLEGQEGLQVTVPANETLSQRLYVVAAPGSDAATQDRTPLRLWVQDQGTPADPKTDRVAKDTSFAGTGAKE